MMKRLFFLSLLFLSLSAMWCKKSDSTYYTPLSQDFLSYFAFPKGSWWVYKEINTGKTDSFYVTQYGIDNVYDKKADFHYQSLSYGLHGNKYQCTAGANPSIDGTKFYYTQIFKGNDSFNSSSTRLFYPFEINRPTSDGVVIKMLADSIAIQNNTYLDICITDKSFAQPIDPIKSEYYCKNIGVIKRVYSDGTVWEVIKYHLNK